MRDWLSYIRDKADTNLWGSVAIDWYSRTHPTPPCDSPTRFVHFLVDELLPLASDLATFHNTFIAFCVHHLPDNPGVMLQLSQKILTASPTEDDTKLVASMADDYATIGRRDECCNALRARRKIKSGGLPSLGGTPSSDVESVVRVCHVSDVHCGCFHRPVVIRGVAKAFSCLDSFVSWMRNQLTQDRLIDLLIVSGDLTSVASDAEFDRCTQLLEEIERLGIVRGTSFWERVIIVPGNHDVQRTPAGGDNLAAFRGFIDSLNESRRHVASPYSEEGTANCLVAEESSDGFPFALHQYDELELSVLTLISCQYSQGLDAEVIQLIEAYEALQTHTGSRSKMTDKVEEQIKRYFRERERLDRGCFSEDYVSRLGLALRECKDQLLGRRIAVAHHNATKYLETDADDTVYGKLMLDTLNQYRFSHYLHGHIHLAAVGGLTDVTEVAASTLGGFPQDDGHNGFNELSWEAGGPLEVFEQMRVAGEWRSTKLSATA